MKKLIVDEVNSFRAEVRAQARASGQIRRQDRCVPGWILSNLSDWPDSLPIPSRDELLNSPMQGQEGNTSGYTAPPQGSQRPPSPVMDDPSEELEKELAGTHLGGMRR